MDTPPRVHASLAVLGMGCPGSEAVVLERRLARLPGVLRAHVNGVTERAYVTIDPTVSTVDEIRAAIRKAGYDVGAVAERSEGTAGPAVAPAGADG